MIPWAMRLMMQLARHLFFILKIIEINELSIDLGQLMAKYCLIDKHNIDG